VKHVVEKIKRDRKLAIPILQLGSILGELRTMHIKATKREKALKKEIIHTEERYTSDSTP